MANGYSESRHAFYCHSEESVVRSVVDSSPVRERGVGMTEGSDEESMTLQLFEGGMNELMFARGYNTKTPLDYATTFGALLFWFLVILMPV